MSLFSWFTRKSKPQAPAAATAAPGGHGKPLPSSPSAPSRRIRCAGASAPSAANCSTPRCATPWCVRRAVGGLQVQGAVAGSAGLAVPGDDGSGARIWRRHGSSGRDRDADRPVRQGRFGIGVPAVYWRTNAQIVVGAALRQAVAGAPAQSRVPEFTAGAVGLAGRGRSAAAAARRSTHARPHWCRRRCRKWRRAARASTPSRPTRSRPSSRRW